MESKLREMIRGVIREYSSSGGGEAGTDKQDAESGNEPKVDTSVSLGSKYWYDSGGTSGQHGQPAKYISTNWQGTGNAAYATQPDAKTKGGPWGTNPDYIAWEKAMADAKAEDQKATGGQGDSPTGGAAGASTGGKKGKKGKKKKDDE
jgi:hypothetical protein